MWQGFKFALGAMMAILLVNTICNWLFIKSFESKYKNNYYQPQTKTIAHDSSKNIRIKNTRIKNRTWDAVADSLKNSALHNIEF